MPTLAEAREALRSSLEGGRIDLAKAAREKPALGVLQLALGRFKAQSFEVGDASLAPEECRLTGSSNIALGGTGAPATAVSVLLTGAEAGPGAVTFTLALTVSGNWTFGTSFPTLPETLRANDIGVAWGLSALRDLRVAEPTFTARSVLGPSVEMSGALEPGGDLDLYKGWVGPWPLALGGEVTLPATSAEPPLFELSATSPASRISIPPLTLSQAGIGLVAMPNEEPGRLESDPAFYSELQLIGSVPVEGASPARLSAPLLVSGSNWHLAVAFEGEGPSLVGGLAELAKLFGLDSGGDLRTPPALGGFETFRLDEIEALVPGSPASGLERPTSIAATIRSDKEWDPPIPLLKLKDVGTRWALTWVTLQEGRRSEAIAGSVFAELHISNGAGKDDGIVDVVALLPSFVITGEQREDTEINLSAAFRQLFGASAPRLPGDPAITDLWVYADPFGQTFEASATVQTPKLELGRLAITEVSFRVNVTQAAVSGGLGGRIRIGSVEDAPALLVRAELPKSGAWQFSGGLEPGRPLTLVALLEFLLGYRVDFAARIQIDRLWGSFDTGSEGWQLEGAISLGWEPEVPLLGKLNVAAGAELELAADSKDDPAKGWLEGRFSVNRLALKARTEIGVAEPQYTFHVQFGELWAEAVTSLVEEPVGPHRVVTIRLGGISLGQALEELVNLAAPTLGFSLDPPWDVLNQITLERFSLVVDPTARMVKLVYTRDIDLLVMSITTLEVKYEMKSGTGVKLALTGTFLGKQFGVSSLEGAGSSAKPLEWDVVKDPPPAIPGKGPKLLELRYLGVGQRVRLEKEKQPDTVADAIRFLREEMTEPAPGADPLQSGGMQFDASSQWLLGVDLRILETVQVAVVFEDPRLYGLSIGLDGERAGALAGLRFEILYKQLAPGLGMFRVELRVPDAFRHIEMGPVSITLGTVVVEIYTNGNFMIDLGFPYGRDYQRSFGVQVFPFVGRGGIYFGVLNGQTSRRVPAIGNGTFSPVLELGVGVAAGVGKEIRIGPLSGGAYLELEVVFQGVLAWFHPTGSDASTARYHWAQGIVALHGKVWGEVDFGIIKASVTLEAYAQATAVFESYRATLFRLEVEVEAEAEVEFLFFTISFSFSVSLDVSFSVGSDEETPWTLSGAQPRRLSTSRVPRRLAARQRRESLRAAAPEAEEAPLIWPEGFVSPEGQRLIDVSIAPLFSVEEPLISWSAPPRPPGSPRWQMAMLLSVANGIPADARTARRAVAPAFPDPDSDAEPVAAASIVAALLRWSLAALPPRGEAGKVTAGELALLDAEMAKPYVAEEFSREKLAKFFAGNLHLRISGETQSQPKGGMAFPAPPWLAIEAQFGGQSTGSDLYAKNPVGPVYEWGLRKYMARFSPTVEVPPEVTEDEPAKYRSFASRVFCDWCLMVAREAVRQARVALEGTKVRVPEGCTLDAVAATLPRDTVRYPVRPNDTVARMADWLGAGVAELEALNPGLARKLAEKKPGETLEAEIGVAGCTLAADNASAELAAGVTVTLKNLRIQVRAGDSLTSLTERCYRTADARRLLAEGEELSARPGVLRAGAAVAMPERGNPLAGSPPAALVAATMYVRYANPIGVPNADWYAQAVTEKNHEIETLGPTEPIPVGKTLLVPKAYHSTETENYTTQSGETLLRIGAALSLQHEPDAYRGTGWQEFRTAVLGSGGSKVPEVKAAGPLRIVILPGESLDLLAERLVYPGGAAALVADLQAQAVLDPLAAITLKNLPLQSSSYRRLEAMAAAVGLTIDELAAREGVTSAPGLFPAGTELTVRHLPAQEIEDLVAAVCGAGPMGEISTQVSRNLLGGTRLPSPTADPEGIVRADEKKISGLVKLTGQQLSLEGEGGSLGASVLHSDPAGEAGWIEFAADATEIDFDYSPEQLAERLPAPALVREPHQAPQPVPVAAAVPRTYGLDHRIGLQAAIPLAIPQPAQAIAGGPSLWPFPAVLVERARAGSTAAYDVLRSKEHGSTPADHEIVDASTFGTLVPLTVKRLVGQEHVYELIGADTADRELLRELAVDAGADSESNPTRVYLGLAPVPGAAVPSGLAVLAADPRKTFLVRSNMATDVPLREPPLVRSAELGEVSRFVQLLWEGSVAESGFHLAFATGEGQDLPAGAFGEDGAATLWLIAIPRRRAEEPEHGRTLVPFANCALVGDGLDSSTHSLYVEAGDYRGHPEETMMQALLPPASAGVAFAIDRPRAPSEETEAEKKAEARLAQLFSLASMRVEGTYEVSPAPPAPPQREPGLLQQNGRRLPRWRRERELRELRHDRPSLLAGEETSSPVEHWQFEQVVALLPADPSSPAPDVTGLPPVKRDPYRGFGVSGKLAKANFHIGYADLFGNLSEPSLDHPLPVDVGYTDPLLGPGTWPGATVSFWPCLVGKTVVLAVKVAAQPGTVLPGPADAPEAAAEAAGKQAERYAEAYYQLAQPTVSGTLLTTLYQDAGEPRPVDLAEGVAPLWRFTAASYLYAKAAASLGPAPLGGFATLQEVSDRYGVPLRALGAANADLGFGQLVRPNQPLTVTAFKVVAENDTAETLLKEPPSGLAPPTAAELLRIPANRELPLRPGTALRVPRTQVLPLPGLTLSAIAAQHQTTVEQLAADNPGTTLRPGFAFEAGGEVVTVEGTVTSFEAVRKEFEKRAVDLSLAELAEAAAEGKEVFEAGVEIVLEYVVASARGGELKREETDTLAGLFPSDPEEVASLNVGTADLFHAGAAVSLGSGWQDHPAVPEDPEQTLAQFAELRHSTPAAVLAENGGLELTSGTKLVVPGVNALASSLAVPCSIVAGETLEGLEARFQPAIETAKANEKMPGVLAAGHTVRVQKDETTYTEPVKPGDTLASLTARFHSQSASIVLADVVTAIQADPEALQPGGLLLMPPPRLVPPAGSELDALTAAQAAAAFGLDAAAFAAANASLPVLATGVTISVPGAYTETTPGDTLNSVLSRFAVAGAQVSLPDLLEANAALAMFEVGARVLLPPAAAEVSASIGSGIGTAKETVFPLSVVLRLQRREEAVLIKGAAGQVARSDTLVPAPPAPKKKGEGSSETFQEFRKAFETAIPKLRLGTARVEGKTADLWVVDLSARGITAVKVRPGVEYGGAEHPRYLALRPLYPELQSRPAVKVKELQPDGELKETDKTFAFQGQDVEVWARRFLADMDLFTSAPYVAAMRTHCPEGLDRLLQAKWTLAGAVAAGLAPVLAIAGDEKKAKAGREAAVRELARACGSGLAAAYEVSTVVQYDATVESATGERELDRTPARLAGAATRASEKPSHQEFSLARGATALDQPSSYVGFALTVPDPRRHAEIKTGPLSYEFDTVQFDIGAVEGMDGYVDSDWLTLLRPLESDGEMIFGNLGSPEVPVPLRSHPAVPLLVEQTAAATYAEGDGLKLEDLAKWTFGLTYSHEHAAQDEVLVAVTFNLPTGPLADAVAPSLDLAEELSVYAALAPRLEEMMGLYAEPPPSPSEDEKKVLAAVAESAATLATRVAEAWAARWPEEEPPAPAGPQDVPAGESYRFRVALKPKEDEDALEELTLTLEEGESPSPTGEWPAVKVADSEGRLVELDELLGQSGPQRRYVPREKLSLPDWPTVRLEWGDLNVAVVRDGRASLAARRNEHLVADAPTNAAFVMSSATVIAVEVATPLLVWDRKEWKLEEDFETALEGGLKAIFGGATGPPLTVSLAYGYQLVPDSDLVSVLPVALYPNQPLLPATIAKAVEEARKTWQSAEKPSVEGGKWLVSLTLSTSTQASNARPLFILGHLAIPLQPG